MLSDAGHALRYIAKFKSQDFHKASKMPHAAKILIVDDDVAEATLTRLTLQAVQIGDHIEHARDGHTGLSRMNEAAQAGVPFNIVILDIEMPGLNGCETLDKIRATDALNATFVAIFTSLICADQCPRNSNACAKKADIYLHKEADIGEFEMEIGKILSAYRNHSYKIS